MSLTDDNSDVGLEVVKSTGHEAADRVVDDRYALHLHVLWFITVNNTGS